MRRVVYATAVIAAILVGIAAFWLRPVAESGKQNRRSAPISATHPAVARTPKLAALAASLGDDSISPIANDLGAPGKTIQRDLQILNEVFGAWETNFPHDGNPVGDNDEITAALAGDNRLHFAFVSPTHPAINARGELCDRWGTPFRFHALSGTQMEIRSAGPDRKFGTADDAEFAPWPKQF